MRDHIDVNLWVPPRNSGSQLLAFDLIDRLEESSKLLATSCNKWALMVAILYPPLPPSRVGHNRALNEALRCLLHVHRSTVCSNDSFGKEKPL